MNFLDKTISFIKTEILGIEEPKVNAEKKTTPKETIKMVDDKAIDKPIDTFSANSTTNTSTDNKNMSKKAVENSLSNIPSEHFDIRKMIRNGLINEITGLTDEQIEKLSNKEKNIIVMTVNVAVTKFEAMVKEGKINPNMSKEEGIAQFSNILYEALTTGCYNSAEEFQKDVGNVIEDLGKDFDKLDYEGRRTKLREQRIADDTKYQTELSQIEKLPKSEQEAARKIAYKRHCYRQKGRHLDFISQKPSEVAIQGQILLPSSCMEYGAKTVLKTRCSDEERTIVADSSTFDFTKGMIQDYQKCSDTPDPYQVQAYSCQMGSFKSEGAVRKYQEDYVKDRNNWEEIQKKIEKGESLTPEEKELVGFMKPEYYTGMSKGFGEGLLNNKVLTVEQKARAIAQWHVDAQRYSDYDEVTSFVMSELKNNPKYKELKAKVDVAIHEILATASRRIKAKNSSKKENDEKTKNNDNDYNKTYAQNPSGNGVNRKYTQKEAKTLDAQKYTKKNKLNTASIPKDIVIHEIETKGIHKTLENFDREEIITTILQEQSLRYLLPTLKPILKSCDFKTVENIAKSCPEPSFRFICSIRNAEEASKLIKGRKSSKGICYASEKQLEKDIAERSNSTKENKISA